MVNGYDCINCGVIGNTTRRMNPNNTNDYTCRACGHVWREFYESDDVFVITQGLK